MLIEANFDGLVGPSHAHSGLAFGNVASTTHAGEVANPRAAALQGLKKMRFLRDFGAAQGVFPPLSRPNFRMLRELGFRGNDRQLLEAAAAHPRLVASAYSSSSMWMANAGTVSASRDTFDEKVHITPANLTSQLHRSAEAKEREQSFREIFCDETFFTVHPPLPGTLADEGAANHTRLFHDEQALDVFVYGRSLFGEQTGPVRYPARQTLEASEAIARSHGLKDCVFLQQSPSAIDAGAFHNDVVAVGHGALWLQHEKAFDDDIEKVLKARFPGLDVVSVPESALSLDEAIRSYLFNSQLVTTPSGLVMIAPQEASEGAIGRVIEDVLEEASSIENVFFFDLSESMQNGGGPACLRLRVPLSAKEMMAIHQPALLSVERIDTLERIVESTYRDRLTFSDFKDYEFARECIESVAEIRQALELK